MHLYRCWEFIIRMYRVLHSNCMPHVKYTAYKIRTKNKAQ